MGQFSGSSWRQVEDFRRQFAQPDSWPVFHDESGHGRKEFRPARCHALPSRQPRVPPPSAAVRSCTKQQPTIATRSHVGQAPPVPDGIADGRVLSHRPDALTRDYPFSSSGTGVPDLRKNALHHMRLFRRR